MHRSHEHTTYSLNANQPGMFKNDNRWNSNVGANQRHSNFKRTRFWSHGCPYPGKGFNHGITTKSWTDKIFPFWIKRVCPFWILSNLGFCLFRILYRIFQPLSHGRRVFYRASSCAKPIHQLWIWLKDNIDCCIKCAWSRFLLKKKFLCCVWLSGRGLTAYPSS